MEVEVINEILKEHEKWLRGEGGKQANFEGANLAYINFEGANLAKANLVKANLVRTNFEGANLAKANLKSTNLKKANLEGANLKDANLKNAYLSYANLICANLEDANLENAYLLRTNLEEANLTRANLARANLRDASLTYANLEEAKNVSYIPLACPSEGAFIGWKKAHKKIIKLLILEDSKRLSANTRKCRCDKAYVMEIQSLIGSKLKDTEICSDYDKNFIYRVGEVAEVKDFCEDRWCECSEGIHFFINRQDAVDY